MEFNFTLPKCFILLSLIPYGIYHFRECVRLKDEREEFIKLQTFKYVQRLMLATLLGLASVNFFYKQLNSQLVLTIIIAASFYSEIIIRNILRSRY